MRAGASARAHAKGWRVLCVVSLCSVVVGINWIFFGFDPVGLDYGTFWRASRLLVSNIYRGPDFAFIYPPSALWILQPLKVVGWLDGYLLTTAFSIVLFVYSVKRLDGWRIAGASLLSSAAIQGLALGQTPMIIAALMLLSVNLNSTWRGVAFGALATIKPQLLLTAPFIFVARKDWAGLFGMLGGATVSLIFSVAVWGLQPWNDWLNFLPQFREFLHVKLVIGSTITLAGQADAAGLNPIPFLLLQVLGASFLALRIPPDAHGSALVAWIVGTSTMASPYSLTHDTVALMPAVITSIVMLNWRSLPATLLYLGWAVHLTLPAYLVAQLLQQDDAEIESSLPSK